MSSLTRLVPQAATTIAAMLSMTYFDFLCNLTVLLIILFTALSYATGLFYMAELAEEFPTLTKRIVRYLVIGLAVLHVLALFSALPKLPLVLGLLLHLSYLPLLTTFPVLPLSSPVFYLAVLLLVATQVGWYYQMPTSPYTSYPSYNYSTVRTYSTAQLLAFYLLFVWLVPLVLFIAGSVTGQSLPVMGERMRGEEEVAAAGGRLSFAGIGRWCKREKGGGGGGREKKDDDRSAASQSHTSHRYEPNPAFYGSNTASPASTSAAYSAYQPAPQQHVSGNGSSAQSWYGQQQQHQQEQSSSEGEWMFGQAPQMAVRQRSHIS